MSTTKSINVPFHIHILRLPVRTICCGQCFHEIQKYDYECAKLWIQLCGHFVEFRGSFCFMENNMPWILHDFKKLEEMGFLLSADAELGVQIRMNGYDVIEIEDEDDSMELFETFCIDRTWHKNQWPTKHNGQREAGH